MGDFITIFVLIKPKRNIMKRNIALGIAFCSSLFVWGQGENAAQTSATPEALSQKVEKFGTAIPQEKVFLHIDNTCYFVGDTIWYKAYVTRSDRQTLTDLSKILYVELLTPDGYLVERQQVEMLDRTGHGAFALTDSLYAGYYELRAYTRWMLNFGQYEHPHSKWTELMFYFKSMAKDFFRDYDKIYSRVFPVFDQPQTPGDYVKDMTLRPMRRYFKSDKGKPKLDLRFYPEGGDIVEGTTGRVAFEANTEEGKHIDIELSIQDKNGKEIARTKTTNRGRGIFTLPDIPAGEKYKAVFRYEGYDYTYALPEPTKEGCAMAVVQKGEVVNASIQTSGLPNPKPAIGLQIMHNGVSKAYYDIKLDDGGKATVEIPSDQLPTGVNQFTLFDGKGRVYADRLIFVNHHEYDTPQLTVDGVKAQYEPFEPISLQLQLTNPTTGTPNVSLAIRDHATDELTYDNGNILTEMLLGSELKGFVENPGYYFEADDSIRRQALDLLMMVQGWRRYSWKTMSGIEPMTVQHMPEQLQTISGCVNRIEDFRLAYGTYVKEENWLPGTGTMRAPDTSVERDATIEDIMEAADHPNQENNGLESGNTTDNNPLTQMLQDNQRDPFTTGSIMSNLKEEVNVWPTFIQGNQTMDLMQTTENGMFYMKTPLLYDKYILFLPAADKDKGQDYIKDKMKKDFTNEEAYPDYFVKLNRFNPLFPKPYSYYQDAPRYDADERFDSQGGQTSFTDRQLATITVRTKRGGLRKLDLSKPALVVDAYEAFNLTADYGMSTGTHNWVTFPQQVALTYIGDMGMDRDYFLQVRYDGKPINLKSTRKNVAPQRMLNGTQIEIPPVITAGEGKMEAYRHLRNLDKLYIYTDYAPREQGSSRYKGDNQPDVIIDYRLFPNDGYQPTYRDRRYVLDGYAVCEDFYSPDYSQKPLPDTKDYRRTLYWVPNVKFDAAGKATVNLYNNSKPTVLSIQAEGITTTGTPIVWNSKN